MKRAFALLCAAVLLFAAFVPAAYAAETDDEIAAAVENTHLSRWSWSPFAFSETSDLPDWLLELLQQLPPVSIDADPAPDGSAGEGEGYQPELNRPYGVTKTKSYYDKNGRLVYMLCLTGIFIKTERGVYHIKSEASYICPRSSWEITAGTPQEKDGTVRVEFTVTQRFTGVPVKTETVVLTLSATDRDACSVKPGDWDLDGRVTASDARNVLRAAVRLITPNALQLRFGDIDGDGILTAVDARTVLRRAVGLK